MKRRTFIQRLMIGASAAMAVLYAPSLNFMDMPNDDAAFAEGTLWIDTSTNERWVAGDGQKSGIDWLCMRTGEITKS